MYIPSFNKFSNNQEAIIFMQRYSFAAIITVKDGIPSATHLPFLVTEIDGQLILFSHFAKANPQSADIINNRALVIFTEPHAYISTANYEKDLNVPTWNYLAVHAYGNCFLLEGEAEKAELLKNTISNYEVGYLKQYESLPDDYKLKMMKGIVGFQIIVDDLQAKKKLSQNRTEKERGNIIEQLEDSSNTSEKEIAEYMKSLDKKH